MTLFCSLLHTCCIGLTCVDRSCFFYKFCFIIFFFVDLTLLVLFLSVFKNSKTHKNSKKKNKKPIKIEKSSKSLIACVVYIICEFGLVPSH